MNDFIIDQDRNLYRDRLYSKAINNEEASLQHYGVLGMKWGVRKAKDTGGSGKKRKGKKAKSSNKKKRSKISKSDAGLQKQTVDYLNATLLTGVPIAAGAIGMTAGALGAVKAGENWLSSKAFWSIPISAIPLAAGIYALSDPEIGGMENPYYIGKDIERLKKRKSAKKNK